MNNTTTFTDLLRVQQKTWLAQQLGVHLNTVIRKWSGKNEWTKSEMHTLSKIFNVTMDEVDQALTDLCEEAQATEEAE